MNTNNRFFTTKSRPIQYRIMRRIVFLLLFIFALISFLAYRAVQFNARDDFAFVQSIGLTEVQEDIQSEIEPAFTAARNIAASNAAQNFALETVAIAETEEQLEESQTALVQQFRTLVEEGRGQFLGASYIMRTGSVWTDVSREGGVVRVNTDLEFRRNDVEPAIEVGLQTEFGSVRISELTFEQTDLGVLPILHVVSPITRPNDLSSVLGVIEIRLDASRLFRITSNALNDTVAGNDGRRYLLLDNTNQVLSDSLIPDLDYLISLENNAANYSPEDTRLLNFLSNNTGELQVVNGPTLGLNQLGSTLISTRDITFGNAPTMPWRLVIIDNANAAFSTANIISIVLLIINMVGVGIAIFAVNFWLNEHLSPISNINEIMQNTVHGSSIKTTPTKISDAPTIIQEYDNDEDAQLYRAAQTIAGQIGELNKQIEVQTTRYNRNLSVAARISRETAQLNDVDELLNRSIELISTSFGLYHAQVFLIDDVGKNAILTYSLGEAGQKLLAQGHKLAVGSPSVIGRVTQSGQPVIVNDTQAQSPGQTHAFNPILKETRAEMAIPLQTENEIIGALDLQSNRPHVFAEEDIQIYQLIADQIAIAVYKTRLLKSSEQRVQQIEKLNKQLTQMAWEELEKAIGLEQAYRYNLISVEAGDLEETVYQTSEMLIVPIKIRKEVIGTINVAPPEEGQFTPDDRSILDSIAQRVALAVENARLFNETQVNLAETSTMYEISKRLNGVDNVQEIIKAILDVAMKDAVAGQIAIFDEYSAEDNPEWMEIISSWMDSSHTTSKVSEEEWLTQRFFLQDFNIFNQGNMGQVILIQDADRDSRLTHDMRHLFHQIDCRAAVFIPLNARGTQRGYIFAEFAEPRDFDEREGRIFANLVDQAGVAIDNLLLLQQTEQALEQNERLYASSRIINQAQVFEDLVRASVATTNENDLNFGLVLFEGELDETGWSTRLHHIAQSRNGGIYTPDRMYDVFIPMTSPMRERQSEVVTDESAQDNGAHEVFMRIVHANGDNYATIYPLFSANQAIALFIVSRKQIEALSDRDQEIYRALSGQMSTVIQNRQLLERTESALDETRRLYDASRAITLASDIDMMFKTAGEHIALPSLRINRVTILRTTPDPIPDAPFLDCVYTWTKTEFDTLFELGQRLDSSLYPFAKPLVDNESSVYLTNMATQLESYPILQTHFQENETRSAVLSPMVSRNNWLGIILIESRDRNSFDDQYVRFIQALADQIAIAIENQLLFEQAQQEARQALALAEASQLANQVGGEFDEGIRSLLSRVAETANYDRWVLMLLNDEQDTLTLVTQKSPSGIEDLVPPILPLGHAEHSIADAVRFNRTLIVNAPNSYPAFMDDPKAITVAGKHIATPIITGEKTIGSLLVGRSLDLPDMTERDETLISTLAAQVAVTLDNRRLFLTAEQERGTLRSILNTLPAGVLVLDAETLKPQLYNGQIQDFLGRPVDDDLAFSPEAYNLYRTGTNLHYPTDELPITSCRRTGLPAFSDDVSVITDNGHQTDLLINAAPITNNDGDVVSIVAAFENISNLRSLENTLQDNLRETISLYEATRSLSEADALSEVLDVAIFQLIMIEPEDAHIILVDDNDNTRRSIARSMIMPIDVDEIPEHVLDNERIQLIDNIVTAPNLTEVDRAMLQGQNIQAIASIPLRTRQRSVPLGWMLITFSEEHNFSPEEERFLTTLSDNAAVAIDNRYLFSRTQTALSETQSLYEATTEISRTRDISALSDVIQRSIETLKPDIYAGYVMTMPGVPSSMVEMFNISMDTATVDFAKLINSYGLFRDETIIIENLYNIEAPTPFEQALIEMGNIQALISVSMRVKNNPDGRLFLAYHMPRTFTPENIRYLNSIADNSSVIVDNITLLDQIQNALEETSTLYHASRALADATTPDEILQVIVDRLIGSHVNQVFIALLTTPSWNTENATVQVVSGWQREEGIDLEGIALTAEQFPAWSLLGTPNVITINDINKDDGLNEMEKMGIASLDTQAVAIIPLRVPSRSIGAIWIGSSVPHYHDEGEQRVYQAFSEQASLTLEASFLLEQTERRARQLATSAEVSQIASSILELDTLLPRVVDLIKESFGYDHVQVFLMDKYNDYAELKASTGEAGQQLLGIHHKLARGSQSVIGQVTEQAIPIIALDTSDARVIHRPNPYLPLTRSEMALPIAIKGQVIGALDVQSNKPNAFTEDDVAVLTTLAAQIAVAIDNARLFTQAESRADEMSFLFTITTAAASANSITEALDNVVELLRGSLNSLAVGVYLTSDGESDAERRDNQKYMRMVAIEGADIDLSEIETVQVGDENNFIGMIAQDLTPVIINNIADEPNYIPLSSQAHSAVIVPQNTGGEVVGMIVMEAESEDNYNQDNLTLLLALSGTLAAIIQNARLLDQMQAQNDELKALDRLKSDFLANMSHELRTPLNSIIGFSRVMLKGIDGPLSEMQEQDLTTIYNSGQHLLGLINDILDQAKIAAEKMDLQKEYFDIKAVVEGVRSIGIGLVKEKPVDIILEMANNLPQTFGDDFRTRQVLLNLVSNAAKFTSTGNITISVYPIQDAKRGTMVRIDVQDSGIGISEKDLPLLFEAFQQIDSSLTRTVGGTGLGLPIAKSLVELQGGNMTVVSAVNVGSTFSITIPTQPIDDSKSDDDDDDELVEATTEDETLPTVTTTTPDPTATQSNKLVAGPPPGVFQQKRQILLIEDQPDMVDQFRRLLQRDGFEVFAASIPLEAEAMASGLRPTLIVMDVNFADGKGWEILEKIKDRDDTFDIPVVVVTMSDESERAYQLGAYQFIQRPHTPDDLLNAVLSAEQDSNVDRVLIIDDNPESTRLIEQLLQEHGKYRVFAAHTGPDGIALVARRKPDLIILDLRMPEMDGFAVLEELRAHPETAQLPIVVVTGETVLNDDERNQLVNLEIIYKTDLNQENYQHFIDEVRRQIANYHGD